MWNLQSFIVLVVIFVLLALAILFIANNGGFKSGCTGHCASCQQRCSTPNRQKSRRRTTARPRRMPPAPGKDVAFVTKLNQAWLHAKPVDCDVCME